MIWKTTSKRTLSLVKRPIVGHLTCSSRSIRSACCKTLLHSVHSKHENMMWASHNVLWFSVLRQRIGKTGRSIPCATTRECAPFKRLALWKRSKMPEMLCRVSDGFAKQKASKYKKLLNFAQVASKASHNIGHMVKFMLLLYTLDEKCSRNQHRGRPSNTACVGLCKHVTRCN